MELDHRLALGVPEIAEALSIGKRTAWGLICSGEIRSVKIGGRRVALVDDVKAYLQRLLEDQDAA